MAGVISVAPTVFRNTNGFLQEIVAKSFFEKKMQNGVNKSSFEVSH